MRFLRQTIGRGTAAAALFAAQAALFLAGGFSLYWSVICLLGGPCPRGNRAEALLYGAGWMAVALALLAGARKAGRFARLQWNKR